MPRSFLVKKVKLDDFSSADLESSYGRSRADLSLRFHEKGNHIYLTSRSCLRKGKCMYVDVWWFIIATSCSWPTVTLYSTPWGASVFVELAHFRCCALSSTHSTRFQAHFISQNAALATSTSHLHRELSKRESSMHALHNLRFAYTCISRRLWNIHACIWGLQSNIFCAFGTHRPNSAQFLSRLQMQL